MATGGAARGPQVGAGETLLRAIAYRSWWKEDEDRPSSAVFTFEPPISVDVSSLTSHQEVLARFRSGSGLVSFVCGIAREIGFDARKEDDPEHPDNAAHAHLYCDLGNKQRKKAARRLVDYVTTDVHPDLDQLD